MIDTSENLAGKAKVRDRLLAEAEARVRPSRRRSQRTASCSRRPVVSSPHCTPIFKKTRTWASTKVVYVRVQLYSWAPVFFVNHLDVQLRHPQLPRAGKPRES